MSGALENCMIGYLVLTSNHRMSFPLLSTASSYCDWPEGAPGSNSTTVVHASYMQDFYQPDKGRKICMLSSRGYSNERDAKGLMDHYAQVQATFQDSFEKSLQVRMRPVQQENTLVVLAQSEPYRSLTLMSKGVELRMYGLYTEDSAVLAFCNFQNYEEQLFSLHSKQFWVYRFLPRDNIWISLSPARLCSRWWRWGKQEHLKNFSARFTVLENHIFNGLSIPHE